MSSPGWESELEPELELGLGLGPELELSSVGDVLIWNWS